MKIKLVISFFLVIACFVAIGQGGQSLNAENHRSAEVNRLVTFCCYYDTAVG
jgi:hypothetical protein